MTDDLRTLFDAAIAREPSASDSWARFTAARRRGTAVRTGVAVTGGLAAFVALMLVLPGVRPGNGDSPINVGDSISPRPPTASKRYADARAGFQLVFPAAWIGRGEPGVSAELYPPDGGFHDESVLMDVDGDDPVRARARTFFVRVHVGAPGQPSELSDAADLTRRTAGGAAVLRGGIFGEVAGQARADDLRVIYPAAPVEPRGGWPDGAPRYWCGGCIVEELTIRRATDVLEVLIVSPGQDAYDAHHDLATAIVDSITPYAVPAPGESPDRL